MAAPIAYSNPSMTPTDVDQRRKLAMSLMQQGTDASPVGHWTQGLARVLQGGMGGYYGRTASDGEKEGIASRGAFMRQAMKDPKAAATAGVTDPWTTDAAMSMGNTAIQQDFTRSQQAASQGFQRQQQAASQAHAERMTNLQHEMQLKLMNAKSEAEQRQLLRQAEALGLMPPAAPAQGQAQATPQAQPMPEPGAGRFAAPALAQAAPAPSTVAAPKDPYSPLVSPAIAPEQADADRKRRAGQALVLGQPKEAMKIMGKDEDPKEYQTKDALWAERMGRAEIVMRGNIGTPDNPKYNPGATKNAFWPDDNFGIIPFNLFNSEKWRQYQGGAREWIAALLRKDTGAAVTETEWKLYFPTYFPQPGDSPEVQKQKVERRVAEARKLRASSGPVFDRMNPGFDQEMRQRMREQDGGATPAAQPASAGFSIRRLD